MKHLRRINENKYGEDSKSIMEIIDRIIEDYDDEKILFKILNKIIDKSNNDFIMDIIIEDKDILMTYICILIDKYQKKQIRIIF